MESSREREREREREEREKRRERERDSQTEIRARGTVGRVRDRERRVPIMPRTLRTVHVYMSTYSMCHIPMQYIFQIYVCSGSLNPKP
jgi:hypothetical protein